MAIQSQPSRIPEPFAGSGTKNTIPATNARPSAAQAASWASGFPPECSQPISAGGCPVPRNDVNGALNQLSQDFAFRQDGGIWEWSALADYDVSRVVRGSDGKVYFSVQQSGPSVVAGAQDPTADDGTYWTAPPLNDAAVVHKTDAETITGAKTFTQAISGATYINDGSDSGSLSSSSVALQGSLETDSELILLGGVADNVFAHQGAKIVLRNPGHGEIVLVPHDANTSRKLELYPAGYMSWSGHYGRKSDFFTMGPTAPSDYVTTRFSLLDSNADTVSNVTAGVSDSGESFVQFIVHRYKSKSTSLNVQLLCGPATSGPAYFLPSPDKAISLGSSARKWTQLYAATSTINTSDARLKDAVSAIPDEVLDAWGDVDFVQYQFKDAVAEKGGQARLHSGLVAQRIDAAFSSRGLDASRYGLFCYDEWDAEPEVRDESGQVVTPASPAGSQYSLRYEEALCMEAAYQRRRADRAEARIADLEERLAAIEAKLNS